MFVLSEFKIDWNLPTERMMRVLNVTTGKPSRDCPTLVVIKGGKLVTLVDNAGEKTPAYETAELTEAFAIGKDQRKAPEGTVAYFPSSIIDTGIAGTDF